MGGSGVHRPLGWDAIPKPALVDRAKARLQQLISLGEQDWSPEGKPRYQTKMVSWKWGWSTLKS